MKANKTQLNWNDRQKEYQRQQEKLKAMASNSDKVKPVSADLMIENLLKDSFKKPQSSSGHVGKPDNGSDLPSWLHYESATVPDQFKYLWSLVQSTPEFADTQKVSQLLLTSGLHVDVLGYIWNLANKTVPGQLTKQEFYIVLALVGLAQTGYTFNNLGVLKLISTPSLPVLQVNFVKNQLPQSSSSFNKSESNSFHQPQNNSDLIAEPMAGASENHNWNDQLHKNSAVNDINLLNKSACDIKKKNTKHNDESDLVQYSTKPIKIVEPHGNDKGKTPEFPCIGSSPTTELEDDFSDFQSVPVEKTSEKITSAHDTTDDFSDFQSANVQHLEPFETVVITHKREIPKIPLPRSFTGKLTSLKSNILKISPESERKLKVLSQSESLSSLPESKISSTNKVSTSISVLGSNHGIGSRLANHSLAAKLDRPKHHKHHKIKISPKPSSQPSDEEIILGVKPTNAENLIPKCCPPKLNNCKTFILKETKIKNDDNLISTASPGTGNDIDHTGENTRQIEIPMLGTFNETVLPTQAKVMASSIDLISVQEDKYSALREVDLEISQDKSQKGFGDVGETSDDFGDFLSADIPSVPVGPSVFPAPEITPEVAPIDLLLETKEESAGEKQCNLNVNTLDVIGFVEPVDLVPSKVEDNLLDFNLLSLNENEEETTSISNPISIPVPKPDALFDLESNMLDTSIALCKGDSLNNIIPLESEQTSTLDGLSSSAKTAQSLSNQSDNEFWEFLASEPKVIPGPILSRQDSLPSLDFKLSPTDEPEQEAVWRKCLETCHKLIREGYNILTGITVKSILDEVFAAQETSDYLNYLYIVYQISKRVSQNFSEFPPSQEDIGNIWQKIEDLCFEYNIKLKHRDEKGSVGKSTCTICLGFIATDLISQGSNSYHSSCANLWINCIEETLPTST